MWNRKAGSFGRRSNRKRGQALVEFALIFPMFMLVLSGILDFGFALYSRMSVINASREGAHAAIIVPSVTTISSSSPGRAVSVASQGGLSISGGNVTTICINTSTGGNSQIDCNSAKPGDSGASDGVVHLP